MEYRRPGYTGVVAVNRQKNPCVVIIETGFCLPTEMTNLLANRGDATTTQTVDALNLGSFQNCYKYYAGEDDEGVMAANAGGSGTHGLVAYRIEWHQLAPNS